MASLMTYSRSIGPRAAQAVAAAREPRPPRPLQLDVDEPAGRRPVLAQQDGAAVAEHREAAELVPGVRLGDRSGTGRQVLAREQGRGGLRRHRAEVEAEFVRQPVVQDRHPRLPHRGRLGRGEEDVRQPRVGVVEPPAHGVVIGDRCGRSDHPVPPAMLSKDPMIPVGTVGRPSSSRLTPRSRRPAAVAAGPGRLRPAACSWEPASRYFPTMDHRHTKKPRAFPGPGVDSQGGSDAANAQAAMSSTFSGVSGLSPLSGNSGKDSSAADSPTWGLDGEAGILPARTSSFRRSRALTPACAGLALEPVVELRPELRAVLPDVVFKPPHSGCLLDRNRPPRPPFCIPCFLL